MPTLIFEVDWANNGTYTDEAARVGRLAIRRGRANALSASGPQHVEPGEAWGEFLNSDRRFDAFNASGALYGNILPGRPVRIKVNVDGVIYPLFAGYLFDLVSLGPRTHRAAFRFIDGLSLLDLQKCQTATAIPNCAASDAINDLLEQSDWPLVSSAVTYPFTFPVTLGSTTIDDNGDTITSFQPDTGMSILEQMHEIADAFGGTVFVTNAGSLAYRGRNSTRPTRLELTGAIVDPEIGARSPWPEIYNEVIVEPTSGAAQTSTDAASVAAYFRRTMSVSGNGIIQDTAHAANLADHLLVYAAEVKRPLRAKLVAKYDYQFGVELMDRVSVVISDLGIDTIYTVGQIEHEFLGAGQVQTVFELEPDYFETSGLGVYPFTFPLTLGW